ncbi:hypothetical protein [Burkholderia sp. BE17]|uniref:hypothetical protein n=1 Tax=Burkholderia sp. BE17 TaxID=2656644 RepID=UPI00128D9437|nr:hypothetical protein [Burkholderia sp. BE17]MPV65841.1 hypothetical protein [Burkholderia sp. BE17]
MNKEIAQVVFALMDCQHKTLKAVTKLAIVVSDDSPDEVKKEIHDALEIAVTSFDEVLAKTRELIEKASEHGKS